MLEAPDIKDNKERETSIVKFQAEFLEMVFHQYAFTKDIKAQQETAVELCEL